jgi:hypothetical protein
VPVTALKRNPHDRSEHRVRQVDPQAGEHGIQEDDPQG